MLVALRNLGISLLISFPLVQERNVFIKELIYVPMEMPFVQDSFFAF